MLNLRPLSEPDTDLERAQIEDITHIIKLREFQHKYETQLDPNLHYPPMQNVSNYDYTYGLLYEEIMLGYPFNWVYRNDKAEPVFYIRGHLDGGYLYISHLVGYNPFTFLKAIADILRFTKCEDFSGAISHVHKRNKILRFHRIIIERFNVEEHYQLLQCENPEYYNLEFSWDEIKTKPMPN